MCEKSVLYLKSFGFSEEKSVVILLSRIEPIDIETDKKLVCF